MAGAGSDDSVPEAQPAMSENLTGPGGNGPEHKGRPGGRTARRRRFTGRTGPDAATAAQANVATSLLNAVLEGNSAVVDVPRDRDRHHHRRAAHRILEPDGAARLEPPVSQLPARPSPRPGPWPPSAFSAMLEGAIFNPHTISAAFHGGSIAAIFKPAVGDRP